MRLLKKTTCALTILVLQACVSIEPNSDYVIVVPIKYVPQPSESTPNSSWGWIETNDPHPDGYRVRIGDMKYHKLIEPLVANKTLTRETAISAASDLAEREVVERQLCLLARVPPKARALHGSQRPSEVWMYVECVVAK